MLRHVFSKFTHRWGTGLVTFLMLAVLFGGLVSGVARAQTTPDESQPTAAATPETGATPAPTTSAEPAATPAPQTTGAPAGSTENPSATPEDDSDSDFTTLSPQDADVMKSIENKTISQDQLNQVKALAVQKIEQYGPSVIQALDDKSTAKQENRLFWIAMLVIVAIPLLGLLLFLIYPLIVRKKVNARAPGTSLGRLYRLYLPQALLVFLLLLGLGIGLWGIQFLTGRVLGGVTNPQLVLQRSSIQYVIDNSNDLINNYTDIMVGIADELQQNPDKPIFDIVLENAEALRNNGTVKTADAIVRFVIPFLNYISLISYGILLLFFLLRIRPDIVLLLRYPVEALAAQHSGEPLPEMITSAVGPIHPSNDPNETMRLVGRKIMITEVKVLGVFIVTVLVAALILSFVLAFFFSSTIYLLIDAISEAAEYFLAPAQDPDAAANLLITATTLLMVFVIECVAIFLLTFVFTLGKFQDVLRHRFAERITWQQVGIFMRKVGLRFIWVMFLLLLLGIGLPFLGDALNDKLYDADPDWLIILLGIPVLLLVVFNVAMFLLRGFKMFIHIFTKSAAAEFGIPKIKDNILPAGSPIPNTHATINNTPTTTTTV